MGMIGHVQFVNLCASGDMGVPNETAALSEGLGWANLAFNPPWNSDDVAGANETNTTVGNSTNGTGQFRRSVIR